MLLRYCIDRYKVSKILFCLIYFKEFHYLEFIANLQVNLKIKETNEHKVISCLNPIPLVDYPIRMLI